MKAVQRTISTEGSISGIGLHTGKTATVFLRPAPAGTGIHFFKKSASVGVLGHNLSVISQSSVSRCSAIGDGDLQILTVEHLLAATYGLGITNLRVDVEGDEIPALDGSALPFVTIFNRLGLVNQEETLACYRIQEPISCYEPGKAISIFPSDQLEVAYCLDYDYPGLRQQMAQFIISEENFSKEIAPARTFCTLKEAEEAKERGFGLGGTPENNIVVDPQGLYAKTLRFPNECLRHKVLDIVGDLSLAGFPILGKVIGIRSGHALNHRLVTEIRRQMKNGKH